MQIHSLAQGDKAFTRSGDDLIVETEPNGTLNMAGNKVKLDATSGVVFSCETFEIKPTAHMPEGFPSKFEVNTDEVSFVTHKLNFVTDGSSGSAFDISSDLVISGYLGNSGITELEYENEVPDTMTTTYKVSVGGKTEDKKLTMYARRQDDTEHIPQPIDNINGIDVTTGEISIYSRCVDANNPLTVNSQGYIRMTDDSNTKKLSILAHNVNVSADTVRFSGPSVEFADSSVTIAGSGVTVTSENFSLNATSNIEIDAGNESISVKGNIYSLAAANKVNIDTGTIALLNSDTTLSASILRVSPTTYENNASYSYFAGCENVGMQVASGHLELCVSDGVGRTTKYVANQEGEAGVRTLVFREVHG